MKYNKSLMGDLQTINFPSQIKSIDNGIDFNFQGYDSRKGNSLESVVKMGLDAHINRVLFWFSTKRNDYVRSNLKGGILYDLIGKLSSDTNLSEWEQEIQLRFNEEFSNDLNIIFLNLSTDKKFRKLYIKMLVQDKLTGATFPVSTEASR